MPIPKPKAGESQADFIARFMGNPTMIKEYPDKQQRAAIAYSTWRRKQLSEIREELQCIRESLEK